MVKIEEIDRTATFAWNHGCLPLLATGTVAGAVDLNFNSSSCLEIWDIFSATNTKLPVFKAQLDNRFYALAWSKPLDGKPGGILAGAFENGVIEFWDAEILIKSQDLSKALLHSSDKHAGDVRTLAFNPQQDHIMVSGGSQGQIYIWDTKLFGEPTVPGKAMTPMDEVSCCAWNNSVSHIFASTGNGGYTLIWDLKLKREVLHLAYNGDLGRANFSFVAWHPTQSTKLVTASDNDGCPVILTWDLRNSNAPEKILKGHEKGVLSLDWCQQDPELLISSGKDNTTFLWNPITGEKLGSYPTTANWAFLTKFAPSAPDIFATASYDGKVIVQTLQDTSTPIVVETAKNEDDFWNEIATTETQQPVFDIKQPPAWLKPPCAVSFGFGSKLVCVKNQNGKHLVEINKFVAQSNLKHSSEQLSKALDSNDVAGVIESRLEGETIDEKDKADWELLKKLSTSSKKTLFSDAIKEDNEKPEESKENLENGDAKGDSFFDNLGESNGSSTASYAPSGSFSLFAGSSSDSDKQLIKLILANKTNDAVQKCIENDKLVEALVLALDSSADVKEKVKNAYFSKNVSELSRVIYGASSKNITDIVANADVEDWKHIANSISAYSTDVNDYNLKITELGDRILSKTSNREDAILCYLAGGALDKIANIWLLELPDYEAKLLKGDERSDITTPFDAHFESLNNFSEKIVTYRAIAKETGTLSGPAIEPICKTILEYSNLLANYGEFELADKFAKLLPNDFAGFSTYKDRISKATTPAAAPAVSKNTKRNQYRTSVASPVNKYAQPAYTPGNVSVPPVPRGNSYGVPAPVAPLAPSAAPLAPGLAPGLAPAAHVSHAIPPAAPAAPVAKPNPYAKPAAANPYLKANPYATNPYAAPAPTNPYLQQSASPTPPPAAPPKPKYKEVTEGWNDLPETFKQKPESRRAAAAAAVSPAPTGYQPPAVPRGSVLSPSAVPPPGPPRAPSRTPSKALLTTTSSPRASAAVVAPVQNSRYAPPPLAVAPQTSSVPAVTLPSQPPKNPYAPPPSAAPNPVSYAPPPAASLLKLSSPRASAALIKNPYAPPAPPAGVPTPGTPRVASGGVIPPKPIIQSPASAANSRASLGSVPPPPGPHTGMAGPPPVAHSISAASTPAPPPVASEPEKYPPGDRSHIPDDAKPVYEIFSACHEDLKPRIPERYAKHGEDMEKRLNILYDHLNNADLLSAEGIASLKEIATNLQAKEFQTASSLILSFASTYPDEIGQWHTGVKRLINMCEALP